MLTDTALKNLKPNGSLYKVSDRDDMYVTVAASGAVTFRYDYRLNGRRETLTIGRYGPSGLSLARAREKRCSSRFFEPSAVCRETARAENPTDVGWALHCAGTIRSRTASPRAFSGRLTATARKGG